MKKWWIWAYWANPLQHTFTPRAALLSVGSLDEVHGRLTSSNALDVNAVPFILLLCSCHQQPKARSRTQKNRGKVFFPVDVSSPSFSPILLITEGLRLASFAHFLQGCLTLRSGPLRNRPVAASPHMHWEGRRCTWLRAWPSSSSALHSTRGCGTLPTPPRAPGGTTTWTSKSCRPGIAVCVGPVSAIFKRLGPRRGGE